jgi:hypothetical protein
MSSTTITKFYAAFAQLDAETMATCDADNASFEDEAFEMQGKKEIMGMWGMLCDTVNAKGAP